MRRTNEAFKAEVFSRSEKYIKQRKDRIKKLSIAMTCIVPLVLCIAILIPYFGFEKNMADEAIRAPSKGEAMMENDIEASIGGMNGNTAEDGATGNTDPTHKDHLSSDGSEYSETIKVSVARYPQKEAFFYETTLTEAVEEMDYALELARGCNIGLHDYDLLYGLDSEGFVIVLEKEDKTKQKYILVENYLFVDNVAYSIHEEDAESITNLALVIESLYS